MADQRQGGDQLCRACTRNRTTEADQEREGEALAEFTVHEFRETEEGNQFGRSILTAILGPMRALVLRGHRNHVLAAPTNAFSKKLSHLKAAIRLHFTSYNFCRMHLSL